MRSGPGWACGTCEGGQEERPETWSRSLESLALRKRREGTGRVRERRARCKDNASIFAYEDVGPTSALLRVLHYISLKKKQTQWRLLRRIYLCNCLKRTRAHMRKIELEPLFKLKKAFWYFAPQLFSLPSFDLGGNAC